MPLTRINSLEQIVQRGARLLGAPLAGVMVTLVGAGNALYFDAASFFVSAVLVVLAVPAPGASAKLEGNYLDQLKAGLRFVLADRLIRTLVVTIAITNCLDAAVSGVMLPVYARRIFGSAFSLGLMIASSGGGAVAGALLYSARGHRLPRRPSFIVAFVAAYTPFAVLALTPPLAVVVAAMALGGFFGGPINPLLSTIFQERTPSEMRGRVFGVIRSVAFVGQPAGAILGAFLIARVGIRGALAVTAACYLLTTLSFLIQPALHEMDATLTPAAAG